MPEIGGTKLAMDFKSMMAEVRKAIDESKQNVTGAVKELKDEIIGGGKAAAKAIREEAKTVREGYSELLGNSPLGTDDESPGAAADASKPSEAPGLPKAPQLAPAATVGGSGGTANTEPFPGNKV